MRSGMSTLAATVGEKSPRYAEAEMAYARVLAKAGDQAQASRLHLDAHQTITSLRRLQCAGCAISALAWR